MHGAHEETGRGAADASGGETPTAELNDLARKLSELRAHLEHVATDLDVRREGARNGHGGLRCHECDRIGPVDTTGWTLRLCGDDALHPFCPECDYRFFNGNGRSASAAGPDQVS